MFASLRGQPQASHHDVSDDEEGTESAVSRWGKKLSHYLASKMERMSAHHKAEAQGPMTNVEAATSQKRAWLEQQTNVDSVEQLARWPENLIEAFYVVGLEPDTEVSQIVIDIMEQEKQHRAEEEERLAAATAKLSGTVSLLSVFSGSSALMSGPSHPPSGVQKSVSTPGHAEHTSPPQAGTPATQPSTPLATHTGSTADDSAPVEGQGSSAPKESSGRLGGPSTGHPAVQDATQPPTPGSPNGTGVVLPMISPWESNPPPLAHAPSYHPNPPTRSWGSYDKPPAPSYPASVLFRYPPDVTPTLSDQEVADLCFPHQVAPRRLRRSPSRSALHHVITEKSTVSTGTSYTFMVKTVGRFPLYGICCTVEEALHRPPSLAQSAWPGCSAPYRQCLITAPRCYCITSNYPFFDFLRQVLNMIIGIERVNRSIALNSELQAERVAAGLPATSEPPGGPTSPTAGDQGSEHDPAQDTYLSARMSKALSQLPADLYQGGQRIVQRLVSQLEQRRSDMPGGEQGLATRSSTLSMSPRQHSMPYLSHMDHPKTLSTQSVRTPTTRSRHPLAEQSDGRPGPLVVDLRPQHSVPDTDTTAGQVSTAASNAETLHTGQEEELLLEGIKLPPKPWELPIASPAASPVSSPRHKQPIRSDDGANVQVNHVRFKQLVSVFEQVSEAPGQRLPNGAGGGDVPARTSSMSGAGGVSAAGAPPVGNRHTRHESTASFYTATDGDVGDLADVNGQEGGLSTGGAEGCAHPNSAFPSPMSAKQVAASRLARGRSTGSAYVPETAMASPASSIAGHLQPTSYGGHSTDTAFASPPQTTGAHACPAEPGTPAALPSLPIQLSRPSPAPERDIVTQPPRGLHVNVPSSAAAAAAAAALASVSSSPMRRAISTRLSRAESDVSRASPLGIVDALLESPVPTPGDYIQLSNPLPNLPDAEHTRCLLSRRWPVLAPQPALCAYSEDELAAELAPWSTALLATALPLDALLHLLNAVLLERSVVFFHPDPALLTSCVLGVLPMLRPFTWQSVCLPLMPSSSVSLLDAPVPFLVGCQYKTPDVTARCSSLVRVNLYKGSVNNVGNLPSPPGWRRLHAALSPFHSRLRASMSLKRKSGLKGLKSAFEVTEDQAQAASALLSAIHAHLTGTPLDSLGHPLVSSDDERTTPTHHYSPTQAPEHVAQQHEEQHDDHHHEEQACHASGSPRSHAAASELATRSHSWKSESHGGHHPADEHTTTEVVAAEVHTPPDTTLDTATPAGDCQSTGKQMSEPTSNGHSKASGAAGPSPQLSGNGTAATSALSTWWGSIGNRLYSPGSSARLRQSSGGGQERAAKWKGVVGELRPHMITHVGSDGERTATLLRESLIEVQPPQNKVWVKVFLETQLFQVYSDNVMATYCEGRRS